MPMFNPNAELPDFEAQQVSLSNQRKIADLLRKQNTAQPRLNMVSGIAVQPHWLERLIPLLNQYQAKEADNAVNVGEQELAKAQGQAAGQWRANMPSPQPGIDREEDIMGNTMVQGQAPQPVTRDAILRHTLAGIRNPLTKDEAMLVNKSLTSDLERTEDKQFRDEQARIAAVEKLDLKKEQLKAAADALQIRLEDKTLDRQLRLDLQRQHDEMMERMRTADREAKVLMTGMIASAKAAFAPKPQKPLPAAQSKAWIENNTSLRQIDRAMAAVKAYPKAFGIQRGLPNALGAIVGGAINQRVDPKGIDARAIVSDLGSLKIHDRSGAAVTAAEFPRLVPFIPLVSDKADTIEKKLKNFKTTYEDIQQEILDFADTQGYKSPKSSSQADETPAPKGVDPKTWEFMTPEERALFK